ncbi:NAD(P)-dependent alcohol dehydrogenase [Streptomyces sp. NPDC087917]|uniref:NAD(P)-dependent alcohol dehydrogenase n=1 Tax=unclassified Streptomyces TaxID=2593676 RepID=UPI00343EE99B
MRAVVQDTYGPPDVLRLEEVERPLPGRGEVLLRVRAAGVDQGVWHLMAGRPYLLRLGFGLRGPRARVRGLDVAGRVESVGPEVTRFRPGDEVYGTCSGAFAQYATAREDRLAPRPASLTAEQAAAVPVSGSTALQALRDAGRLAPGHSVLVIGASGGVGSYAVQLAKALGAARVTGVCAPAKADFVRSLGADAVLAHTRDDPTDGTHRHDLVIDTGGNHPIHRLRRALTPRGTLVIVGGESDGRLLGGTDRQVRALLLSPFVGHRLRGLASTPRAADLAELSRLADSGAFVPAVDRAYPLAQVADAIRFLRDGRVRGKLVVTV